MSTLFISHSSKDNAIAITLQKQLLAQHHHSIFLDLDPEMGIQAGQSWEQTLYRKLRACGGVIAVCTKDYLASKWCFAEIALARMEGKHIIALIYDENVKISDLPSIITERQIIKMTKDPKEGYQRLWNGLKEEQLLGVDGDWDPGRPPYLGLASYKEKDAAVFFGRNDEIRAGVELVSRGAPNMIMIMGASGSGKSSLVMAGIVPKLRRFKDQWIILDPFRPGRDPFTELSVSLAKAFDDIVPKEKTKDFNADHIKKALLADAETLKNRSSEDRKESKAKVYKDERLALLLTQMEAIRETSPDATGSSLQTFLDWSIDDLRRICGEEVSVRIGSWVKPGTTYLNELAQKLRHLSKNQRYAKVLIVVDQFEEFFGQDEELYGRHDPFLRLLRASLEAEGDHLMMLGSMRSDFLGQFQQNKSLRAIDYESISLGPMGEENMREIIEKPAELGAIELEEGLSDKLIKDTETSDALPLLSFTLRKLWDKYRDDGKLEISEYEKLGGLQGAITREADMVLATARKNGKEGALRLAFLKMARLSEDGSYARQPASLNDKELQEVKDVLDQFIERRLMFSYEEEGTTVYEVAHESLFRNWRPLKTWLDDDKSELLLKQQLERDAKAWKDEDHSVDLLWIGGRLQRAEELSLSSSLFEDEELFIGMAIRKKNQKRRRNITLVTVVMVALMSISAYAFLQAKNASNKTKEANEQLSINYWKDAGVVKEEDYNKGLHIIAEAINLSSEKGSVANMALDYIKDTSQFVLSHPLIWGASFSKDDSLILSWGGSTARLWIAETAVQFCQAMSHESLVIGAVFSSDESRILTWSVDGTAKLWDAKTTEQIGRTMTHNSAVVGAVFSSDERRILTWSDGTTKLWDLDSMLQIDSLVNEAGVRGTIFSSSGKRILTWGYDYTAGLWDAQAGDLLSLMPHHSFVVGAIFSSDERRILTWSDDGTAKLWNARTGVQIGESLTHHSSVVGAVFSSDERRILTWSDDGTAKLWDAGATGVQKGRAMTHKSPVVGAVFSSDESRILTWSDDGTAKLWYTSTCRQIGSSLKHTSEIIGAVFSSDESRILTWSNDRTAKLWDTTIGRQIGPTLSHQGALQGARFSNDGNKILSWSDDGLIRSWNISVDDDSPKSLYLQHIRALTGEIFNIKTNSMESLSENELARLREKYIKEASAHYRICKYPEENLFKRYYPEEAAKVRPLDE